MKARMHRRRALSAVLTTALLTGCVNLDPKPDPHRYYVIEGPNEPAAATLDNCPNVVLVGPVRVAGYADQAAVVERRGSHEIVPLTLHRWAESPGQALPRALTSRLARELPGRCVAAIQRRTPTEGTTQIELEITRFELTDGNAAVAALRWRAFETGQAAADRSGTAVSRQPFEASGDRVAAGIDALSRALDDVVRQLAEVVAR